MLINLLVHATGEPAFYYLCIYLLLGHKEADIINAVDGTDLSQHCFYTKLLTLHKLVVINFINNS